jgi:hypothetical protein
MKKEQQIKEFLKKPFQINDVVEVCIPYVKEAYVTEGKGKKKVSKLLSNIVDFHSNGKIVEINHLEAYYIVKLSQDSSIPNEIGYIGSYNDKKVKVLKQYLSYNTSHIGADPFVSFTWDSRIQFYSSDIEQVLWRTGFDRKQRVSRTEKFGDVIIPEIDFNPVIIDKEGKEVVYQRPYVWTLKEKQLLIDSIYNNIEIGKIVVRKRSFSWVKNRVDVGLLEHTAFSQMVDGKQRVTTLLSFINNEFPDSNGNYFSDLSVIAQRKFFSFRGVTFGELGEEATDEDVLRTFLMINHAGVPQSEEHINFVKSLL